MPQNNRPAFLLYKSFYSPVKHLKDDELGLLFRTLFEYQDGLEIKNLSPQIGMAFAFFKNQFDLDDQKYKVVLDRNKSNGSKGGRPKKEETQSNPENPVGFYEPRKGEKEKETDKEIDKEKEKEIIIPDFLDASLWNSFLEMRKSKKAKPTPKAIELLVAKLTDFYNKGLDPNQSLANSIESNWTGVFEPKPTQGKVLTKGEKTLKTIFEDF